MKDYNSKIVDTEKAILITNELNKIGKKIVLTGGCFDILHVGHIVYLAQLITNKDPDNVRLIHRHYSGFIKYIKENFKNVDTAYWRQWDFKKKVLRTFRKGI